MSVAVRIRPRNEKEILADMPVAFSPSEDNRDVQELNEDGEIVKRWSYDNVFGPDNNNKFIFDTMGAKLVDAALDGYNSVLFMYGQTSSGSYARAYSPCLDSFDSSLIKTVQEKRSHYSAAEAQPVSFNIAWSIVSSKFSLARVCIRSS